MLTGYMGDCSVSSPGFILCGCSGCVQKHCRIVYLSGTFITMEEFSKSVNEFLEFRRYDILKDNGRISHKQAVEKAYQEYDIFNKTQPIESDFDNMVKGLSKAGK